MNEAFYSVFSDTDGKYFESLTSSRNMAASNGQRKIILIGFIAIFCSSIVTDGDKIGVDYGMSGDNLPKEPEQVVTLMNNNNIGKMRIYSANNDLLNAFANSGIEVIVGLENPKLQLISSSQDAANGWVNDNIRPFPNIKYIAVGNEVLSPPNTQYVSYLVPAMTNIQTAIQNANLQDKIKVSTTHTPEVVNDLNFNPPSQGAFSHNVSDTMSQILKFLSDNGGPFMADFYPYFSYFYNRATISLEYALFKPTSPVLDGDRSYSNLFDAMVDTLLSAMESLGYSNVPVIITESGWPSAGNDVATVENAQTYNNNLIKHVLSKAGTPKRPGMSIETYIFALFNENLKTGDETERHFGLFNPDKTPVYPVNFSAYEI